MTAVEQLLAEIKAIATDEHDKGDRFERLMLYAFQPIAPSSSSCPRCGGGRTGRGEAAWTSASISWPGTLTAA